MSGIGENKPVFFKNPRVDHSPHFAFNNPAPPNKNRRPPGDNNFRSKGTDLPPYALNIAEIICFFEMFLALDK